MNQRIAVLGTGANGASIAADLTRAGLDVVLIDQWPENVETMRNYGVRIEMAEETLTVPVRAFHLCDIATFDEKFDIVLLVIKAYDTSWASHLIRPYLKKDGLLVGVQNGMTVDTIAEVVGADRTMGCVIEITSQMFDPGVVQRQSPPERSWFAVGAINNLTKGREAEIKEILSHVGTTVIASDIRSAKWMKLISNCTTLATSAIFGIPMAKAASNPELRDLMVRSGSEALTAGQNLGYRIEPIFGLSKKDVLDTNNLVELLLDKITSSFIVPETITTVLQDHLKNRRSEVENINGWVVEQQENQWKSAPVNAAIIEISKRIKCGKLEPNLKNLHLIKKLISKL